MDEGAEAYLFAIGRKVEQLYREKYPSLNSFAQAVECDERTIRRIIRGEQNVSILLLRRIAEELAVAVDDLLP